MYVSWGPLLTYPPSAVDPSPFRRETCRRGAFQDATELFQTPQLLTSQLPRANHSRMELSPASAASEAFRAAEIIRIAAQKPKKEDYSDYEVFRQEYKSWHGQWTRCQQDPAKRQAERERDAARHAKRRASSCLQITHAAEPAQPCFKKPRGRAPLAEGKPCSWNSDDGFWTTANGCYHDVAAVRKASKTEHFQRSKRIDVEEQNQRRSLCARIAAAVEASGVPAPSASRRLRRPSERCGRIVLTPAPLFWAKAQALVAQACAQEEFLTWQQFKWHYHKQLKSQLYQEEERKWRERKASWGSRSG